MSLQYADLTVVSCDGRRATADVLVFGPNGPATVRVSYVRGGRLEFVAGCHLMMSSVLTSKEVLADVHEAVMEQRDSLRERN